jgi:hypothetical protein
MAKKRVPRASAEFEGAELGDERPTKRLAKIADTLATSLTSPTRSSAASVSTNLRIKASVCHVLTVHCHAGGQVRSRKWGFRPLPLATLGCTKDD